MRNINRTQRESESSEEDRSSDVKYKFYPKGSGEPLRDLKTGIHLLTVTLTALGVRMGRTGEAPPLRSNCHNCDRIRNLQTPPWHVKVTCKKVISLFLLGPYKPVWVNE